MGKIEKNEKKEKNGQNRAKMDNRRGENVNNDHNH